MKITLRELRQVIRQVLSEAGSGNPTRSPLSGRNPMSPEAADREQMSFLADQPTDVDPDDDLPAHLREPAEDREDCFGPVPPTNSEPFAQQDPFVRDSSPLPSPSIKR